ncbi:WecB/TagA/CpsF family glycosyltransferase [Parafilimonas sp.]|uniref:WecB/TagA/CpsF family glycosyltransferase n=1 Tax=Parafilimonas sp. TaxID=1969739 RepID=UPI0039E64562
MPYKLLGTEVNPYSLAGLLQVIKKSIDNHEQLIVASQNLHSIYLLHKSKDLQALQSLAIKRVDGMPIVYMGRLLGYPLEKDHRITWVDLIHPLMKTAAENGWRVFYLGADEKSVSKGMEALRIEYPSLKIDYRNGFFDAAVTSPDNNEVIIKINAFNPDILIVGMGMPRQEKWIYENRSSIHANVIMTCGAAIEYVAGTVKIPPRWMGRAGLEWFFRLTENPKRFWYRYMVEPWYVFGLFVKDFTKKRILNKPI